MSDNGNDRDVMAARIGYALGFGPLTIYGACLVATESTEADWRRMSVEDREHIRSQVRVILERIPSIDRRLLTEDTQGKVVIYFLISA